MDMKRGEMVSHSMNFQLSKMVMIVFLQGLSVMNKEQSERVCSPLVAPHDSGLSMVKKSAVGGIKIVMDSLNHNEM